MKGRVECWLEERLCSVCKASFSVLCGLCEVEVLCEAGGEIGTDTQLTFREGACGCVLFVLFIKEEDAFE